MTYILNKSYHAGIAYMILLSIIAWNTQCNNFRLKFGALEPLVYEVSDLKQRGCV